MVVTRFAPSPTGHLHIGGLRTALFNYLYARGRGGKCYLRIEDTDLARNSQEATEAILQAFAWMGLGFDGEILYQSQRLELYQSYVQQLLEAHKAYYCYTSKEELEALRETQRAKGETPRYDRRYRDFTGTSPQGVKPVVRLKAPLQGEIAFKDGIKGVVVVQAKELDDFIIARADGTPTYNFVVSIDDALMGISDIIRGDDHLSNTPKQILIYQALGFKLPNFYHVPMILNEQGRKLSKRDGAMGVMDYKALGYLKEALLNFLARLGWSYGDQEIFSLEELLRLFDAKDLNSAPSCFSPHKLDWLNAHYLKATSNAQLEILLQDFELPPAFDRLNTLQKDMLLGALKERCTTLKSLSTGVHEVLNPPVSYDPIKNPQAKPLLEAFAQILKDAPLESLENIQTLLHTFLDTHALKPGAFMPALRVALLGKKGGIDLKQALFVLGDQALERLQTFLARA
ncbi:glutamate--tRNA ligase [Helicobacter baculiformis]|uniref:Glutamate--tRNA ligase n=1 Tax=Helicobacter baculiformis TaxID=427351 RepID=A0ABV7ZJU2_9HELI|nr:glutamate--tRNA ligase [Helicobacter baculiformis]